MESEVTEVNFLYRRRRKIRYYNGAAARTRLSAQPWFPYALVAVIALVLALILGAILGGISKGNAVKEYPKKDLYTFGGVKEAAERFADVKAPNGEFISLAGLENGDVRYALRELEFGDAVVVLLYDEAGQVFYDSDLSGELSLAVRSSVTPERLAERIHDSDKASIGVFVSSVWGEENEAARILKKAQELALLSELASTGMDQVMIMGLTGEEALLTEVNSYLRQVAELFEGQTLLTVAVNGMGSSEELARMVSAALPYADRFVLDLCDLADEDMTVAVERNAYYLTYYKMAVLYNKEEQGALLDAYGIEGKLLFEKNS